MSTTTMVDPETKVIPIEITSISELTNVRAAVKPKPKPIDPIPEDQPMTLETPMENAEEQGEVNPVERPSEDSVPEQTPDSETAEIEQVIEEPKKGFDLDRFASVIDRTRETQPEVGQQRALQSEENFVDYSENARDAYGEANALTMSEIDALRQKMYKCWRIPADAKNPEELVVTVRVKMRSDGTVTDVRLHEPMKVSASSNPFMSVAARRAVNAVTACGPYDFLPTEKYAGWQDIVLRFIPEV